MGKLNVYENTKVYIAGIITHIRPLEDFSGAEKLTIAIRDLTASIDVSFWRQRAFNNLRLDSDCCWIRLG